MSYPILQSHTLQLNNELIILLYKCALDNSNDHRNFKELNNVLFIYLTIRTTICETVCVITPDFYKYPAISKPWTQMTLCKLNLVHM